MEEDKCAKQAQPAGVNPDYRPDGASPSYLASPDDMRRREKLAVEQVYGHVDAFIRMPNAQNYDNLALSLREMQTAWMNGRKRVMD